MEVYLVAIFVFLSLLIVYILHIEHKSYAKPIVKSTPIGFVKNSHKDIPDMEIGFDYYTTDFRGISYTEAMVLKVFAPIHTNVWSISSYNSKWELATTQCLGPIVNSLETIKIVLSPNQLYTDEISSTKKYLSIVHQFKFLNYDPDEKYNFVLKVPENSYVTASVEFLTSTNIGVEIIGNGKPLKTCNMFDEHSVIDKDSYNTALDNVFNSYGEIINNIPVAERINKHSLETVSITDSFTLGFGECLCIFYTDHSSNRGCLYSRITLYSANDNQPIETNITGVHTSRNHVKEGLKSGMITFDTPGTYYIKEFIGPTRKSIRKIHRDTLILMVVNIVDSSKAEVTTHTVEI
jgi:hypothetical protein